MGIYTNGESKSIFKGAGEINAWLATFEEIYSGLACMDSKLEPHNSS